jgi:hypothetical protein
LNNLADKFLISGQFPLNKGEIDTKNPLIREVDSFLKSGEYDRIEKRFFASFSHQAEMRNLIVKDFSKNMDRTIKNANRIIAKEFPIFGYESLAYGIPVCWQIDPKSGKKPPRKFWTDINYLDFEQSGDHKVIWELNRHQYLLNLGKAYWATGDEKYMNEWIYQINDWMQSNPPKYGINWTSNLEIAFRSISWIWCLLFFKNSKEISHDFLLKYLYFLIVNGAHIEKNLSFYFSPNTHLTGEALGLFYLGLLFLGTKKGDRWLKKGISILLDQLDRHVLEDGVYFEQSTYYHRYTTDFYTHLYILMQRNSIPVPEILPRKLLKLLDFLVFTQKPNGKTPFIGDDDGGRLLILNNEEFDDFRSCLSTGSVLFRRGDYKERSGGLNEETIWLLGPSACEAYHSIEPKKPIVTSKDFPVGGYYVMRNRWDRDADYLMLDCGPHGWKNGGHAHSDLLSFVVSIKGKDLLIDPGTYTYTNSLELRNYFRCSLAHNTLSLDHLSQSKPGNFFLWESVASPVKSIWLSHEDFDFFSGRSEIYKYLEKGIFHQRQIFFIKREGFWVVFDQVTGNSIHPVSLRFHFSSVQVNLKENTFIVYDDGEPFGIVSIFSSNPMKLNLIDDWRSPVYSMKEPSKTGECIIKDSQLAHFVTMINSYSNHQKWEYKEEKGLIELKEQGVNPHEVKFFIINPYGAFRKTGDDIKSDFSWIYRYKGNNGEEKITMVFGKKFALKEKLQISFSKKVNYMTINEKGNGFWVIFSPETRYQLELIDTSINLWINEKKI